MSQLRRPAHIAYMGLEKERVYVPAEDQQVAKVFLLLHQGNFDDGEVVKDRFAECLDNVKERLGDKVEEYRCDIFDFGGSLVQTLDVINNNSGEYNIKVNITTGSKITAISGLYACLETDAMPFYVHGDYENSDVIPQADGTGKPVSGVSELEPQSLNDSQAEVLARIEDGEATNPNAIQELDGELTWDTAQRLLEDLEEKDLVRDHGLTQGEYQVTEKGKVSLLIHQINEV